jgi:hypothetical protein
VTFSVPLKPSKWLQKILLETEKDFLNGKNIAGPFKTADEMIKNLRS